MKAELETKPEANPATVGPKRGSSNRCAAWPRALSPINTTAKRSAADPNLFRRLVVPLGLAVAVVLIYTLALTLHTASQALLAETESTESKVRRRAFGLWIVVLFTALIAVFAPISMCLIAWFGTAGVGRFRGDRTGGRPCDSGISGNVNHRRRDQRSIRCPGDPGRPFYHMAAKAPIAFTVGPNSTVLIPHGRSPVEP
jgi:hypothetical protein